MTSRLIALLAATFITVAGCSTDSSSSTTARESDGSAPGKTKVQSIPDRTSNQGKTNRNGASQKSGDTAEKHLNGFIIGGIIAQTDGVPVPRATVRAWTMSNDFTTSMPWQMAEETKTDKNGRYRITSPRGDRLAITARAEGFAVAATNELERKKLPPDNKVYRVDLELQPEVPLAGRVVDQDGVPVVGAHVLGDQPGDTEISVLELQTFTDPDGRFIMRGAAAGNVLKLAVKPTTGVMEFHTSASPNNNVEVKLKDKAPTVDGRLISDEISFVENQTTVTLSHNTSIHGLYIREQAPVAHDGTFNFGPAATLDTGLTVNATPLELFIVDPMNKSKHWDIHHVPMDGQSTTVLIHVTTGHTLRARVVDVETSAPMPGVEVSRKSDNQGGNQLVVKTDQNGFFAIQVTSPEMISLESPMHHVLTAKDDLQKFADDYSLTHTIVMKRAPFIRGIIEGMNGEPVVAAKIKHASSEEVINVGPGGTFEVKAHPGASYSFFATAPGYAPAYSEKISVKKDDVNDVRLRINRGRRASGIVVDPIGNPVVGAKVSAEVPSSGFTNPMFTPTNPQQRLGTIHKTTRTDISGRFTLPLLPTSETIRIIAEAAGYAHPVYYSEKPSEADLTDIRLQLPESIEVNGKVVNGAGAAVPDAQVIYYLTSDNLMFYDLTNTSTSGTFYFKSLPHAAKGSLSVRHSDYDNYSENIKLTDPNVSITLTQSEKFDYTVECLDLADNSPVSASLQARHLSTKDGEIEVEASATVPGQYILKDVTPGGMLYITAKAEGYRDETYFEHSIKSGANPHKFLMRKLGTITGRVISSKTKEPVPGATLKGYNTGTVLTTTDDDGRFKLQLKASGSSGFYAQAPDGRSSRSIYPPDLSGESYDVGDLEVDAKQPVTVRVVRGQSSDPVKDVKVEVTYQDMAFDHHSENGKTDSRGEFSIELYPSKYLSVSLPDYGVHKNSTPLNLQGQNHVVICQVGSGILRGKLLLDGKETAGRITGTCNKIGNSYISTNAPSNGKFEFENLLPGRWKFTATTGRGNTVAVSVEIPSDDQPVERDIEIVSNRELVGFVVDENGKPVKDATVAITTGNNNNSTVSDSDGKVTFNNAGPGDYSVYATHATLGKTPRFKYNLPETGDIPELKIILEAYSGSITCTALSILDGLPVPSAIARLKQGQEIIYEVTQPGTSAVINIEHIKPGNYQLEISASGYSQAIHQVTVAEGQPLEFTDVLSPAADISLNVIDKNGSVVTGAAVTVTPLDSDSLESPRATVTTDEGKATFEGLLSGNYQLQAISPDGAAGTGSFSTRHQSAGSYQLIVD